MAVCKEVTKSRVHADEDFGRHIITASIIIREDAGITLCLTGSLHRTCVSKIFRLLLPWQGDPYKTLFVARLSYDATEKKLRREFEEYGPIKRLRVVHNKNKGAHILYLNCSRDTFGLVTFALALCFMGARYPVAVFDWWWRNDQKRDPWEYVPPVAFRAIYYDVEALLIPAKEGPSIATVGAEQGRPQCDISSRACPVATV